MTWRIRILSSRHDERRESRYAAALPLTVCAAALPLTVSVVGPQLELEHAQTTVAMAATADRGAGGGGGGNGNGNGHECGPWLGRVVRGEWQLRKPLVAPALRRVTARAGAGVVRTSVGYV